MDCDVLIIGAGLAGAAAAWELTGRGHSVVLLEAHALQHDFGSSHGTSRIYRRAYLDPFYVRLTGVASPAWDRLEADAGVTLRTRTGGLDTGGTRDLNQMHGFLTAQGVEAELLAPGEITDRWPGMTIDGPALFHADAGYLNPDATIRACVDVALGRGLRLLEHSPALAVQRTGSGLSVSTAAASYTAARVVVAAGAWLPELLPVLPVLPVLRSGPAAAAPNPPLTVPPLTMPPFTAPVPPFTVKQQEVFHFRRREPAITWPTIVHKGDVQLYGLPSGADGGSAPAMKIGQFDSKCETTASTRDGRIDPAVRAAVCGFVHTSLPGLDPEPVAEQSCLFTMTPDEDFVLDRAGDVVIASPCSGHGAKFAPLLGTLIADLVEGGPPNPRFAFRP